MSEDASLETMGGSGIIDRLLEADVSRSHRQPCRKI